MTGQATIKLPFPTFNDGRTWSAETWREKQFRENWKRFKKLCSLLTRDGLSYTVVFRFDEKLELRRWESAVEGMIAEVKYHD